MVSTDKMAKLTILLCLALFAVFALPVHSQTLGGSQAASRTALDDLEKKLIEVFRNYYIENPSWDGFGVKSVLSGNYQVVSGTIYDVNIEIVVSKSGAVVEYEAHVTESLDGKIVKVIVHTPGHDDYNRHEFNFE